MKNNIMFQNKNLIAMALKSALLLLMIIFAFPYRVSSQPFVGEIRIWAGEEIPEGWLSCEGQQLLIADNEALFNLIGTYFGGDGQTFFNLPDLRGRVPIHNNTVYPYTLAGGAESVTLTVNQLPSHGHNVSYNKGKGETVNPTSAFPARNAAGVNQYGDIDGNGSPYSVGYTGGSQPHENRQPYLAIKYIISLWGMFPHGSKGANSSTDLTESTNGSGQNNGTDADLPYISEIKIFAFDFAPSGYAKCNGQILQINTNQALFSLLGTTYGGNGQTNFALPDLRGKAPLHRGQGPGLIIDWNLGENLGEVSHTVNLAEIPSHNHTLLATGNTGNNDSPANNYLASNSAGVPAYSATGSGDQNGIMLAATGGNQPHENMKPYLALNYCIATTGIFPSYNKGGSGGSKGQGSFIGEIMIMANNFAPEGYLECNGQSLDATNIIYYPLYSRLGNAFGGSGYNFNLPDLRGRLAIGTGQGPGLSNYNRGNTGGGEYILLSEAQIPIHVHAFKIAAISIDDVPDGKVFGPFTGGYISSQPAQTMNSQVIQVNGYGTPHFNLMPGLGLSFYICYDGYY